MPYNSATYAANVDKIFATMGPYIVKCNATTGERESMTKLFGSAYGDLSVCYHPGTGYLFAGSGSSPTHQVMYSMATNGKDIYRIDPTTMAITACQAPLFHVGSSYPFTEYDSLRGGPYQIIVDGDYVIFLWRVEPAMANWGRMHATGLTFTYGRGFKWKEEQLSVDGTYVYKLDPYQTEIEFHTKTLNYPFSYAGYLDTTPYTPVAVCYCPSGGKLWVVCGDEHLLGADPVIHGPYTEHNLSAVAGPSELPDPCRIQYLSDGKLWLPCVTANGFVVWDPLSNTGTWKGGFETPIDVVETPTKKFAVQLAPVGLKEII